MSEENKFRSNSAILRLIASGKDKLMQFSDNIEVESPENEFNTNLNSLYGEFNTHKKPNGFVAAI